MSTFSGFLGSMRGALKLQIEMCINLIFFPFTLWSEIFKLQSLIFWRPSQLSGAPLYFLAPLFIFWRPFLFFGAPLFFDFGAPFFRRPKRLLRLLMPKSATGHNSTWWRFGPNPHQIPWLFHIIFPGLFVLHAGTWHGFRASSSHGISWDWPRK